MPFLIAALVLATGFCWTIHLVVAPDPWAVDSALAIAIGCLVLSVFAVAAMLLSRGHWTRLFAAALVISELSIATVGEFEFWLIAAVVTGGLSLAGLWGPWLTGWLRRRPAAAAPRPQAVALSVGAFTVVPIVGLAAPAGLAAAHGFAGALGILLSWAYAKGQGWALWGLRLALPAAIVTAAAASPPGGTVLLLLTGAILTYLAWTPAARLAIDPLPVDLPTPRGRQR